MTGPRTVAGVLRAVVRNPWEMLGRRWNYKSAILSAVTRSSLFFTVNLGAGVDAAAGAALAELCFRLTTAGFFGALTQAFRHVESRVAGTLAAMVVLPATAHSLELLVHWARGTPALAASVGTSVAFTALSTAFNLHAMRHGALIVGEDRRSIWADLLAMPRLVSLFVTDTARTLARVCL